MNKDQIDKKALDSLLDDVIKNYKKPEDILGDNGILKQLSGAIIERVLKEEMSNHLGYSHNEKIPENINNSRNGQYSKKLRTKDGDLEVVVPRDRNAEFEPQFVKKHQTRFEGFDDKIISMYSRGMSTNDIKMHLQEIYGTEISQNLISQVTNGIIEEVRDWQNRPLDEVYPIIYMDAIRLKVRDNGHIKNKAVHLALGVNIDGQKELLGMWIADNEGAKFWLQVMTELKNRGLKDIFIACVDGLTGFPEAIESIFPKTEVQLCIVHMIRNSTKYVSYRDRKEICGDLKMIYKASTEDEASHNLDKFAKKWDKKYPAVSEIWRRNWTGIIPFLAYPTDIRKAIYTTNAIESMNDSLKKITKPKRVFPTDDSVLKLLYLGIRNISKKWTMPIRNWSGALNQFAILFSDRFPKGL